MAEFNFDPFLTGGAGDFAGQVGGYDIGAQPTPTVTAQPEFTGSATQYAPEMTFQTPDYTPTFAAYDPTFAFQPTVTPEIRTADQVPFGQFASTSGGAGGYQPNLYAKLAGPATTTADLMSLASQYGRTGPTPLTAGGAPAAAPTDTSQKGPLDTLLGKMSGGDIVKLLTGGLGGVMSYLGAQKAQEQAKQAGADYAAAAQKASQQFKDVAAPYLTAGGPQLSMALQGALGPAQMQAYQAAQARLAQTAAKSGGVGAIQTAAAEQQMYQTALQSQQTMALQLLGTADPLLTDAIKADLSGVQDGLAFELKYGAQAATALGQMMASLGGSVGRTA